MSKQKGLRSPLYFRIQMVSFFWREGGRYGLLCILFWVRGTCKGGSITLHFLLPRRFPELKNKHAGFRISNLEKCNGRFFFTGNNVLVSIANKYRLRFETLFKIFLTNEKKSKEENVEEILL